MIFKKVVRKCTGFRRMYVLLLAIIIMVGTFGSTLQVHAASITASVDWGTSTGETAGSYNYGLNLYKAFETTHAGNSTYKSNVAYMKPGIVRYHRAQQCKDSSRDSAGWVINADSANYAWDANKINTILSNTFSNNPVKMMNIANWPEYMDDGSGKLRTDMYDEYAEFCADLVRIVNIEQGRGFTYWEVTNEKDNQYNNSSSMAELAEIFNLCAAAMKNVDPTIKVGGPAFARPDLITDRVEPFIKNTYQNLDFVSYHTYHSGSTSDSNSTIWDRASSVGNVTENIKTVIAKYTDKEIETFHDEYNISWNPPDDRMTNVKGMIFDALAMISMAKAGVTGSMAWNECDGWYGKLDNDYSKRSASHLYKFFNEDMRGTIVESSSGDTGKVVIMATKGGTWRKIALVNRSESDQTVQLSFSGWSKTIPGNTEFVVKRVHSWGASYDRVTYDTLTGNAGYTLPSDTVTVLVLDESTVN